MRMTQSGNIAALRPSAAYINCCHQLMSAARHLLVCVPVVAIVFVQTSLAQEDLEGARQWAIDVLDELPANFRALRQEQTRLASDSNITVRQRDEGRRSVSGIREGVPRELLAIPISNEKDLQTAISTLYPYFAFTGTESLRFERKYSGMQGTTTEYLFREYIDGIETSLIMTILVDDSSKRVARIQGNVHIDRQLERTPLQSVGEAIELVLRYIGQSVRHNSDNYLIDGEHFGQVIYQPSISGDLLTPVWRIEIEFTEPGVHTHDMFVVDPNGDVRVDAILPRAAAPRQ